MSSNNEQINNGMQARDITSELMNRQQHSQIGFNAPKKEDVSEDEVKRLHDIIQDFYLPFFKENRKKLLITNENPRDKSSAYYYCTITKEAILFEVKSDVKKDAILYDFQKSEIFHNKEKKDGNFLADFVEKLEKMSGDIRNNKAEVYEEFFK